MTQLCNVHLALVPDPHTPVCMGNCLDIRRIKSWMPKDGFFPWTFPSSSIYLRCAKKWLSFKRSGHCNLLVEDFTMLCSVCQHCSLQLECVMTIEIHRTVMIKSQLEFETSKALWYYKNTAGHLWNDTIGTTTVWPEYGGNCNSGVSSIPPVRIAMRKPHIVGNSSGIMPSL